MVRSMFSGRGTKVRFFLAFWLFVLSAVAFLDRTNISIAGVQILHEYGLSNQKLGWIFSAFLIGYAGFQIPAGLLSARYGPRVVLTFGVIWWCVSTALMATLPSTLAHALPLLIAIRFLLGAGESVVYPAANQFVARWIPQQERGFVNGLIFAGVGAGSGLTPPLLTWLIVDYGWRSAFWFSTVVGLFAAAVWWIFSRDTPDQHLGVSRLERQEILEGLSYSNVTLRGSGQAPVISLRAILARKDLAALTMGYFSFGYVAWVFFSWFFLYMQQVRGFDMHASARYAMLPFLCMTVFSLIGGWSSDWLTRRMGLRAGRCYMASVSMVLTGVFLIFGANVHSPALAGIILAGGAGALYMSSSSFWSVSVDIAGPSSGVFSSFVNMGGQLGGALTASLTPWIAQRFGWTSSFAAAACMAVLGGACWLVVHPERALDGSSKEQSFM